MWILKLTDSTVRFAPWGVRLSEFGFDVVHRAGVIHHATDALSRLHVANEVHTLLEDVLPLLFIDAKHDDTIIIFFNDNSNKTIPLNVQNKEPIDTSPTEVELIVKQECDHYWEAVTLNVGQSGSELYIDPQRPFVQKSIGEESIQNLAQTSFGTHILYLAHQLSMAGHPGKRPI